MAEADVKEAAQAEDVNAGTVETVQAEAVAGAEETAQGEAAVEANESAQAEAIVAAEEAALPVGEVAETDEEDEEQSDDGSMSIIKHLEEMRRRLIKSLIAIALCSCVTYYFLDDIMHYITQPAGTLYFLQPAEAFFTYIKVTLFTGFLLSLPFVFYQAWAFFLPALTRKERLVLGLIVPSSVVLFLGGLAFSFLLVLPAGIRFFMGIGTEELMPMFSVEKYLDFVIAFVLPFGFVFEVPLILIVLAKMGFVTSKFLISKFRYVFFLSFVFGAIISPTPDIFTQSMIALPLSALYALGMFIVKYIMRK